MEIKPKDEDKFEKDLVLVKEAISGNNTAYASLLNKYYKQIYIFFSSKGINELDAEDLTMETFGKAFKSLANYDSQKSHFITWLYTIAKNNHIDYFRRRSNSSQEFSSDNIQQLNSPNLETFDTPEKLLIKNQTSDILKEVINMLQPKYKELIYLRYFKELSYKEIAEQLNLPINSVKARLFKAKELLYPLIKKNSNNI